MNAKRIWFVLPACLLPYVVLSALAVIFYSSKASFFNMIIERFFEGDGLRLILTVLSFAVYALLACLIGFILSIIKNWNAVSLAKTAMIIKLIQIPAYLLIFFLGAMFMLNVFTYLLAVILFWLNCLTLFMTGLLTSSSAINACRGGLITKMQAVLIILLQFVFVADVVASIVHYSKLSKS